MQKGDQAPKERQRLCTWRLFPAPSRALLPRLARKVDHHGGALTLCPSAMPQNTTEERLAIDASKHANIMLSPQAMAAMHRLARQARRQKRASLGRPLIVLAAWPFAVTV